jgi:hypothetical protein
MHGSLGLHNGGGEAEAPAITQGRTRAFRSDTRKNPFAPRAELLRFSPLTLRPTTGKAGFGLTVFIFH